MNIAIIEDEDPKLDALLQFLESSNLGKNVRVARSVRSGMTLLRDYQPDLLLLDMSLPTFDISANEPGGRPQGYGGIEIIRHLDSSDSSFPIIVVSAYPAFAKDGKNIELKKLAVELMRDYPNLIRGVVYFNPVQENWSDELASLIKSCATGGGA